MCVLLFVVFKHLLLRKTGVLKTCGKNKFLGRKIWRNALALKNEKIQGIFGKALILALLSSAAFPSTKQWLRSRLNCFVRKVKGFCQSSLGNEIDFGDIMNVSPNILTKILNFKTLTHDSVDERPLITTTLISSCHWKTFVPFACERKDLKMHF